MFTFPLHSPPFVEIASSILFCNRYQQLHYQIDPEYLFSPENGAGKLERSIVEEFFHVNYTSNFNVGRITRPGKIFYIFSLLNYNKY